MTTDKEFLKWIYARLAFVHEEKEDCDYMIRLKCIIDSFEKGKQ